MRKINSFTKYLFIQLTFVNDIFLRIFIYLQFNRKKTWELYNNLLLNDINIKKYFVFLEIGEKKVIENVNNFLFFGI